MQLYPRTLANLLVILVQTLVNLLVKPTKIKVRGAMGGAYPPLREPLPGCIVARNTRNPCPSARIGVDGETTYETTHEEPMRTYETYEGNKRLPLYDFRSSFPTFLGELDSSISEFLLPWLLVYMATCFFSDDVRLFSSFQTSRTFRAEFDSRDHFSRIDFPPLLRKGGKRISRISRENLEDAP